MSRTDPRGFLLAVAFAVTAFAAVPANAQDGYTIIGPDTDTATIQRTLKAFGVAKLASTGTRGRERAEKTKRATHCAKLAQL